jgi:VWFA-related protein
MVERVVNRLSGMFRVAMVVVVVVGGCGMAEASAQQVPTQQASAQQVPTQEPTVGDGQGGYTLQVNAQRVVLDVVVTDKHDAPVNGLTKDDFTVFEDKAPQAIRTFEETAPKPGAVTPAISSTAELDRLEPDAPVSILVIDEVTTSFEDLAFVRYSLNKYLKAQGDVLEQPTLLVSANFSGIAVLHDYTTSRKVVLDAMEHHLANYPALGRVGSMTYQSDTINATFRSLIGVAEATAGHPGHKNLIWMGRGFPAVFLNLLRPEEKEEFQSQLASCTRLLRDSRVTLDTLDPVGVAAYASASDGAGFFVVGNPFANEVDLDRLAASTGGRAIHGRNDLNTAIDETVRDGASFYTLAYRPSSSSQNAMEFRNIKVVMKDKSYHAKAREGYFAAPTVVAPLLADDGRYSKRVVFDFNVASSNLLSYDGVHMTVTRDATTPDKFILHVRAGDLALQMDAARKPSTELTIAVASFDRKGNLLGHNVRVVAAQVNEDVSSGGVGERSIPIPVSIATTTPAARIRFVVRANGNGKIGAESYFLVDRSTLDDPATGIKAEKVPR